MAVKDYNVDPDLNTTIEGINIAEGCPPSGINNAIRQLMADVKEESTAQTQAVAGAKTDASQQVSALDRTLRALIAQELEKKLSTSGGTMTGDLYLASAILSASNTGGLGFYGGTSWRSGAYIEIPGPNSNTPSILTLYGASGTALQCLPDGWKIAGYPVLTSAGGTMATGAYISGLGGLLRGNSDVGDIWISGQPVSTNGSFIQLNGGSCAGKPGYISISPGTPTSRALVEFGPDGTATINGYPVLTSAGGFLMNGINIIGFPITYSNGWTAPAGGTWLYFICGHYNSQNIVGMVAGGGYVSWPNSGHDGLGIAFKVG